MNSVFLKGRSHIFEIAANDVQQEDFFTMYANKVDLDDLEQKLLM